MKVTNLVLIILTPAIMISCGKISKIHEKNGDNLSTNEQYLEAIIEYNKAIRFDETNKFAIHSRGRAYEDLGDYDNAIKDYTRATEIDTVFALAYRSRGFSYYSIKDYQNSIVNYLKSIAIDSTNASAFRNAASVFKELCDYENARRYYYKSFEIYPNHYGAMDDLADIEFDLGNYDSCLNLCYRIIGNLTEGKDAPHGTLGLAYIAIKQYDSAIVHLDKALKYKPWCHYYNNRGYAYSLMGMGKRAIEDYDLAIKLDSLNPNFYLNRADSKYFIGMYEEAINDYDKAISLSELYSGYNCGICFNNRAHAKIKIGDSLGYEIDMAKAKELGYPDNYKEVSNLESCFYNEK